MPVQAKIVTIPYAPRTSDHLDVHRALEAKRFGVVVSHRRFGKTVLAINQLLRAALKLKRERPRFGYLAPTLKQAKTVAWDYLKHYCDPIPGRQFNEQELRADFPNGGQVRLFGADNPDALRGGYLDGIVPDEFGLMQGRVWSEVLRPMLSDRRGWAMFIGTPNGHNAFWEIQNLAAMDPEWFLFEFPVSQTKLIPDDELESARKQMTPDEYLQEYECSFEASVRGAVYAKEMMDLRTSGRIREVPWDPLIPVDTFWDLGMRAATAIWFSQRFGPQERIIDYYEATGEGLPHYAHVLQNRRYVYGTHWAPHDITVRDWSLGYSRREAARKLGLNFRIVPQMTLQDGVHATRMLLPRCVFDARRCNAGLEAMMAYRWEFNTRIDEFKPTPVDDWAAHGADAFRMKGVATVEVDDTLKPKKRKRELNYPTGEGAWAL